MHLHLSATISLSIFLCSLFFTTPVSAGSSSIPPLQRSPNSTLSVPTLDIIGVADSGTYRTAVFPRISVSDGAAEIKAVLDNKPYDNEEISSEGRHTLEVEAVDANGNRHRRSLSFVIDRTSPITAASIIGQKQTTPKILFLAKSSSVELSPQDPGSSISGIARTEFRFGDATEWKAYSAPIELNLLVDGRHTLHFRSVDNAGNIETTNDLTFFIDSTGPSSSIDLGAPQYRSADDRLYASGATGFTLSAHDSESGNAQIEYRLDKSSWKAYLETFRIEDEGEHRIEFRASDNVGNIGSIKQITVYIDTTPPISSMAPESGSHESSDIYFTNRPLTISMEATDRISGVAKSEYKIDQGPWQTYAPFTLDNKKDHTVSFRSSDNVNNQETTKILEVQIDKTPPTSSISVGLPVFRTSSSLRVVSNITFITLSAEDSQSGIRKMEYRINDGEWLPYEPFTIQNGGEQQIEYRSTDKAGNSEAAQTLDVFVDTFPPVSMININKNTLEYGETVFSRDPVNVTLTASDKHTDVKLSEYKLDNGPWTPYQPFSIASEGAHLLEFRGTDSLGNSEPTRFVKIIIDTTPPVTNLIIGEPKEHNQGITQISDKTVLALSAVDELSGPPTSEYRIIGRGERLGSEPFSIATEGEYEIIYLSADQAGNVEQQKSTRIKVVIPPPPLPEKGQENSVGAGTKTEQIVPDQEIPDSIRIQQPSPPGEPKDDQPAKTAAPAVPTKNIDDESAYLLGFERQLPVALDQPGKPTTKEYLGIGGINALIIALIFLVL